MNNNNRNPFSMLPNELLCKIVNEFIKDGKNSSAGSKSDVRSLRALSQTNKRFFDIADYCCTRHNANLRFVVFREHLPFARKFAASSSPAHTLGDNRYLARVAAAVAQPQNQHPDTNSPTCLRDSFFSPVPANEANQPQNQFHDYDSPARPPGFNQGSHES